LQGDISDEASISASIAQAVEQQNSPINILCANAGITDESNNYPIWEMPSELWDQTYAVNVRGTYLTIKHFLKSVDLAQKKSRAELSNVSVVVTGSECGVFGQAGHVEYASGKAGLQYGLVKTVKNEIVRLNSKARINAVAPGWVDTKLIEGRLDDAKEMWREAQATYVSSFVIPSETYIDGEKGTVEKDRTTHRRCKSSSVSGVTSSCRAHHGTVHFGRRWYGGTYCVV
jgi:NAD(P)-dependent dehydrogenase (short-subunit alcohol dehydrogenase family)